MLPVFTEIKSLATVAWYLGILSDGIKEHKIQVRDCENIRFQCKERKANLRTIFNVYIGPEIFTCTNGPRLAALQRCADKHRDLDGVRVLNPLVDEGIGGYPINGAWENDIALNVTFRL